MRSDICSFVTACDICQRNKHENVLSSIPIPKHNWTAWSMDFIERLQKSSDKQVIFVVVDRQSKYAHFMPLTHPYTSLNMAQFVLDNVYKLHGLPNSIINDRDKVFINTCWQIYFPWWMWTCWWEQYMQWMMVDRPPPSHITYIPGKSTMTAIYSSLRDKDAMICPLKANLVDA